MNLRLSFTPNFLFPKKLSFLTQLNWREATKKFDTEKKIDHVTLEKIVKAIQMAPTSFGLQPFHVHIVQDLDKRIRIQETAHGQPQVSECSHLLVFCTRTDIPEKRIDELLEIISGGSEEQKEKLKGFSDVVHNFLGKMNKDEQKAWADRQTYIALSFAIAACAELGVDSCPMEGFSPEKTDEILHIPKNQKTVVLLPIGYRKEKSSRPKVRFPKKDLFS